MLVVVAVVVVAVTVSGRPDNVGDNLMTPAEVELISFFQAAMRRMDQLPPLPRSADLDISHRRGHLRCERCG